MLCLFVSLCLDLLKLVEDYFIKNLNVSSLHTGRTGLDHTCTLKFTQCIYDHRSGDTYAVSNLAGNKDAFVSIQFIKDMDDRLKLSEGQGTERRFHDLLLSVFLRILIMNRTHHFQTYNSCTVLTDNNIFNIIRMIVTIHK